MLRDAAIGWVNTNCTDERFRADFARKLEAVDASGVNCWFIIGSWMTRGGVPYLIHWFAGELFILQLTERQMRKVGVAANEVRVGTDLEPMRPAPRVPPLISLEALEVEEPRIAGPSQPFRATCRYRALGPPPDPYCVRMDYSVAGKDLITSFDYPLTTLREGGTLTVAFTPIRVPGDPNVPGLHRLMAVFVRVCLMSDGRRLDDRFPVSNAAAALLELEIKPPPSSLP